MLTAPWAVGSLPDLGLHMLNVSYRWTACLQQVEVLAKHLNNFVIYSSNVICFRFTTYKTISFKHDKTVKVTAECALDSSNGESLVSVNNKAFFKHLANKYMSRNCCSDALDVF